MVLYWRNAIKFGIAPESLVLIVLPTCFFAPAEPTAYQLIGTFLEKAGCLPGQVNDGPLMPQ